MPIEKIGYRRLYDSIGCSLTGREELEVQFPAGATFVLIYMGPKPKFGITVTESDKYVIPGKTNIMVKSNYYEDASKSTYPRNFFTEISCWKEIEVSQELSDAFHSQQPNSHEPLLKLAHANTELFSSTVDLFAATIGLRYHWQFIIKMINENLIAFRNENKYAYEFASPGMRILEDVSLNPNGVNLLGNELTAIGKASDEERQSAANALQWLTRAWTEDEVSSKFVSLFVPLEMILAGHTGATDSSHFDQLILLRELAHEHGGEQKRALVNYVNGLLEQQRPSLSSRFEEMASKAKMVGWENDVLAFKKFNSMRNQLLHRGQRKITTRINLSENEVRDLEDLVERYVSFALFGDGRVYLSRFRPVHMKKID